MTHIPCCTIHKDNKTDLHSVQDFLKVICEEHRLKILCILKQNDKCVCEICEILAIPQNLVSHHLKVLKDFDLIQVKQQGRKSIYSQNKHTLRKHTKFLNHFLHIHI
ncbi:MAG: winged helix-turn-helix transcriptional regulator [Candidatus Magasanikbacteria bacterium]|jgi:ArsR family transcriptional regulator, arsenate/arsenite/antimonite-responsive transcriptional repressor|nr:winged helix-turn-helix transcriptional regulator [Candidatus Magasanikbacteria bacterium]MBT4071259.1 winged helix-turn-helix transcriptional regulator [Candidatus Magasanikbacteria bacterium]